MLIVGLENGLLVVLCFLLWSVIVALRLVLCVALVAVVIINVVCHYCVDRCCYCTVVDENGFGCVTRKSITVVRNIVIVVSLVDAVDAMLKVLLCLLLVCVVLVDGRSWCEN